MKSFDISKLKQQLFSELKSVLTTFIEGKFKEMECKALSRSIHIDRPSSCHDLPHSVSSDLCIALKQHWPIGEKSK